MTYLVSFTARGCALCRRLLARLPGPCEAYAPPRLAGGALRPLNAPIAQWAGERFEKGGALLFVGAAGIAVRAVAPHLAGKDRDPAVLCMDEAGSYVIPLVSGHLGGANRLARGIAELTGAQAVITTATDVNGVFAFDDWAAENGCAIADAGEVRAVSAVLLEGGTVGLCSDFPVAGALPEGVSREGEHRTGVLISLEYRQAFQRTLHLIPRCVCIGIGCRKGVAVQEAERFFSEFLREHRLPVQAVSNLATIDRKAGEPAVVELCRRHGLELRSYSAMELAAAPGRFSASAFVKETVGVDNVCERAAVLASGGRLLAGKTARNGVTLAAARLHWQAAF